jgi:multicomponent K+:H+ antiporter subunit E/multicomponent Na+:H+ antiporter subunit E
LPSPGEFLVDVDWIERVMLIHVLDASDPEEVRRDHQRFYVRFQRAVFP